MAKTVWRDDAARNQLDGWFARFRDRIAAPVESCEVPTRHGISHVLLAGRPDGPPLVCLHAMRTGSAFFVSELGPLFDRFRIIAPDLPGQSDRGPQVRLPLDELNLGASSVCSTRCSPPGTPTGSATPATPCGMPFDFRIPPLASDDELRRLTMPVLVLGAADDISFPGEALVRRVSAVLPQADVEVIPASRHCPPTTPEFRRWLADRLSAFLGRACTT